MATANVYVAARRSRSRLDFRVANINVSRIIECLADQNIANHAASCNQIRLVSTICTIQGMGQRTMAVDTMLCIDCSLKMCRAHMSISTPVPFPTTHKTPVS